MNIFNEEFFSMLYESSKQHSPDTDFHSFLSSLVMNYVEKSVLADEVEAKINFGPYGDLIFPFFSMGNIDSLKLFGLDELILFSFYWKNKDRYKKVADMGANIGLHSVLMSRLGWQVTSFEPDPIHTEQIAYRAEINDVNLISVQDSAITDKYGDQVFTRLKGNRTGSHLKGKKERVYGEVEEFTVSCIAFNDVMSEFEFIKMDIEGAEADAICSTNKKNWENTEVMLEVGNEDNSYHIWKYLEKIEVNAFSQLSGWNQVRSLSEMPKSYKDGSLFLTRSNRSPFNR